MKSEAFVPADFDPPTSLVTDRFRREPPGPEGNGFTFPVLDPLGSPPDGR